MNTTDDTPDKFACETDTELRMLARYIQAVEIGIEKVREEESAELESLKNKKGVTFMQLMDVGIDHIVAHTLIRDNASRLSFSVFVTTGFMDRVC